MFKRIERYSLHVGKGHYKSFRLMSVIRHLLCFVLYKWEFVVIGTKTFRTKCIIHVTVIINDSKGKKNSHQNGYLIYLDSYITRWFDEMFIFPPKKLYVILSHNEKPCNYTQNCFLNRPVFSLHNILIYTMRF